MEIRRYHIGVSLLYLCNVLIPLHSASQNAFITTGRHEWKNFGSSTLARTPSNPRKAVAYIPEAVAPSISSLANTMAKPNSHPLLELLPPTSRLFGDVSTKRDSPLSLELLISGDGSIRKETPFQPSNQIQRLPRWKNAITATEEEASSRPLHLLRGSSQSHRTHVSLSHLLATVVAEDLCSCDLILILDIAFHESLVVIELASLQNLKQIVFLKSIQDLDQVTWKSPRCQGTLMLLSDPRLLVEFGNQRLSLWDYKARVIIAGLREESLEEFIKTRKGRKTEHIIGLVEGKKYTQFKVFMNQLFWGPGMKRITTWNGNNFRNPANFFPDKVSNLQKGIVKVLIFEWQPAIIYHRDNDGTLLRRYGRDVAIIEALAEVVNFTILFDEIPEEELFGLKLPNGSFNGMVGRLGGDLGDIGVANLYISAIQGRDQFQEYSTVFAEDKSCYMARVDPPPPLWQSPALPFQMVTWISVFIGLLLSAPVLYLLSIANGTRNPENSSYTSFRTSSLFAYGVHVSYPMPVEPRCSSTRVFVIFLCTYCLILTTAYKSNLTAFLTVTRKPQSIETFKELHESGLKVFGLPFFETSLRASENPYLRALADKFEVRIHFEETTKDILDGRAVTINSKIYLDSVGARMNSPSGEPLVRNMRECFSTYSVCIAYPRNSPLKYKFDQTIARMFESGLVNRWLLDSNKLYQQLEKKLAQNNNFTQDFLETTAEGFIPIGMDHIQGVFILLLLGYLNATLIFVAERIFS